jgi:hypothetical protein
LRMLLLRSHYAAVSDNVHGKNYISNRDISRIGVAGRGKWPGYVPAVTLTRKV